ncbi:MAG: taurine ABC transporter substrate-binding protein, partial [Burkholderiales bacterium]
TFDGLIANKDWAAKHPDFLAKFAGVMAKAYADYNANKAQWNADSSEVKAMVKLVGGKPKDDAYALTLLKYPTVQEQVSPTWLGGGKKGAAVRAFAASAKFLKSQRQIDHILPDYSPYVTAKYAEEAAKQ